MKRLMGHRTIAFCAGRLLKGVHREAGGSRADEGGGCPGHSVRVQHRGASSCKVGGSRRLSPMQSPRQPKCPKLEAQRLARCCAAWAQVTGHCQWLQEAEQRQAAEEAAKSGDDANDLEKAQDFGRLRTMKVQQAVVTGQRFKAARLTSLCLQTVPRQHAVSGLQLLGHHSPEHPPEERLGDEMPPDAPLRTLQQQPAPPSWCLAVRLQRTRYSQHLGLCQKHTISEASPSSVSKRPLRLCRGGGGGDARAHAPGAAPDEGHQAAVHRPAAHSLLRRCRRPGRQGAS